MLVGSPSFCYKAERDPRNRSLDCGSFFWTSSRRDHVGHSAINLYDRLPVINISDLFAVLELT